MERKTKLGLAAVFVAVAATATWMTGRAEEGVEEQPPTTATPVLAAARESGVEQPQPPVPARPAVPLRKQADLSPAKGCAADETGDGCSFLEPDDDALQEMARCGIARYERPRMARPEAGVPAFPAKWRETAGVTDVEHDSLERAAASFAVQARTQWADLAATAGIDRAWAETSSPVVVSTRILAEFDEDQYASAVDHIARERAGWDPATTDIPETLQTAVRMRLDEGDAFEAAMAEAVGKERAAELRAAGDGWPGERGAAGNHCEVEVQPPRARDFVPSNDAEAEACIDDPKKKGCAFLDPTELELERMADCGVVRFDAPSFLGARFSEPTFDSAEGWASNAKLTPTEAAALAEVGDAFRDSLYRDLSVLAVEAGKTQAWADQTPFLGMMMAISEGSGIKPSETEALFRRLAEERAGRTKPPTDLTNASLDERFLRRVIELGDAFEQAVAERIGAERAKALRDADDGWPGLRLQTQNYCDGGPPQTL